MDPKQEIDVNFIKNTLFGLIASEKIDAALAPCLAKSLLDGVKITPDMLEDESVREDYLEICMKVAEVNVLPFVKSLSGKFFPILAQMGIDLQLRQT